MLLHTFDLLLAYSCQYVCLKIDFLVKNLMQMMHIYYLS